MILAQMPRTSRLHKKHLNHKCSSSHNLMFIKIATIKTQLRPWSQCNLGKIPSLSILHNFKSLRILRMLPWWDQEETWSNSSHLSCNINHRLWRLLHNLSSQCNTSSNRLCISSISRISHLLKWDNKLHKWTISFRTNKWQVNKFLSRFSSHKPWGRWNKLLSRCSLQEASLSNTRITILWLPIRQQMRDRRLWKRLSKSMPRKSCKRMSVNNSTAINSK